jgi:hypothetical protein
MPLHASKYASDIHLVTKILPWARALAYCWAAVMRAEVNVL